MAGIGWANAVLVALLVALLAACGPSDLTDAEKATIASLSLDSLRPLPDDPTNRVADEPLAAALGASLFFDTGLSRNGEIACATCHKIDRQFQDDLPLGRGIGTMNRRTMPLTGVAWSTWQFWDGRKDSLWSQALAPLENQLEHGTTRTAVAHEIVGRYGDRYARIFGPAPDISALPRSAGPLGTGEERAAWSTMSEADKRAVDTIFVNAGKAIAAFERSIAHEETRFDRFARAVASGEEPEGEAAFTDLELEGLRLFIGKANCVECHIGPRFTDDHFHNTGVPALPGRRDEGRAVGIREALADPFNCFGEFSDAKDDEACAELKFAIVEGDELIRAYKTPSLRGAASRPPYMHAGQIADLDAVIDHYSAAPEAPAGNTELRGVVFTERGRQALVAFLKTLDQDTGD